MPVQAFVDDSGGKGHTRHLVLAGLAGHSESWAAFSDEWRDCLSQPPRIGVFKMREAAARTGQFYGVSEKQRDDKLRALVQIINRHARLATHSIIDLDAHAKTWALTTDKPRNDPYFWPFHNTIMAMCFQLWDLGWRERFEIIFDEQVIFGPRAKFWYPLVREVVRHREPDAFSILPVDPIFRSDDDFLPLQAADLFAWCHRKATDDPAFTGFEWLLKEMPNVASSEYSQYYDLKRMQDVTAEARRLIREGAVPDELSAKYKEMFGQE